MTSTSSGSRPVEGLDIEVTVVIPARNEVAAIDDCLAHVLAQDWPHEQLEVIVVDGGSDDGTGDAARKVLAASDLAAWQVVTNPQGSTPSNLNRGLEAARGRYLCRVDARSFVPPDYVRRCVEALRSDSQVRAVGGRQVARASASARSVGIARALNNRFAMGGARYRGLGGSGPVDTVYLGFFRVDDLRAVGGWDLRFPTNQDFDLNRRLAGTGGLVWFLDGLEVGYQPRGSLSALFRQYRRFGSWKVRYWRMTGDAPRPRQVVLLAVPPLGAASGILLLLTGSRRRRAALVAAGAAAAATIEHVGAGGPRGGIASRLCSVAALACISGGWLSGVGSEWLKGR